MSKTAFIFPGQGSQYVGMGRDFFDNYQAAREYFDIAGRVVGFDISSVIFNGPEEELKRTSITQPAVYLVSSVVLRVLSEKGIKPDMAAGHSLGEYTALLAAGVFDFETGMRLVKMRGEYIERASKENPGSMAAVMGGSAEKVKRLCDEQALGEALEPVNFNSPDQIVIAGSKNGIKRAVAAAREYGLKRVIELKVSGPFHSSLMNSAAEMFKKAITGVRFNEPQISFINNCRGIAVQDPEEIKNDLIMQIKSPVLWQESIEFMNSTGAGLFYEIGPGKVLAGLNKKIIPAINTINIDSVDAVNKFEYAGGEA